MLRFSAQFRNMALRKLSADVMIASYSVSLHHYTESETIRMTERRVHPKLQKAFAHDTQQLIEVCNVSFGESLRWRAMGKLALSWWQTALTSSAVESWCIVDEGRIAALCVLVIDEMQWKIQRRIRRGSNLDILFSILFHPGVAFRELQRRIKGSLNRRLIIVNDRPLPTGYGPRKRTWIELVAVRPEERGKGLGKRLLDCCNRRTIELHREFIALRVESANLSAKRLYENAGYNTKLTNYVICTSSQ